MVGSLSDYLTRLPSVTQTATMMANANVPETMVAKFKTSALVVCGCMALVYQIVTYTRANTVEPRKINRLFLARLPVIGMVTICHYGDYQSRGGWQERLVAVEPVRWHRKTGWMSNRLGTRCGY